jgi:hypothetical protein
MLGKELDFTITGEARGLRTSPDICVSPEIWEELPEFLLPSFSPIEKLDPLLTMLELNTDLSWILGSEPVRPIDPSQE